MNLRGRAPESKIRVCTRTSCNTRRRKNYNRKLEESIRKTEKVLPRNLVILLDENMSGVEAFRHERLPGVADVYNFRGNGWSGLDDCKVMVKIEKMAIGKPNFMFVVLTRDQNFIKHSRCTEQKINIKSGNLRVLPLTWETFFPTDKIPKLKTFANIKRERALGVLKKHWLVVLNKVITN